MLISYGERQQSYLLPLQQVTYLLPCSSDFSKEAGIWLFMWGLLIHTNTYLIKLIEY